MKDLIAGLALMGGAVALGRKGRGLSGLLSGTSQQHEDMFRMYMSWGHFAMEDGDMWQALYDFAAAGTEAFHVEEPQKRRLQEEALDMQKAVESQIKRGLKRGSSRR